MKPRLNIKSGDKYGKFTVLSDTEPYRLPSGQINRAVLCECECGNIKTVRVAHLTRGRISSCGCIQGERHGECKSLLYNVWRGMKNRCHCQSYPEWHLYGGKGVEVCREWRSSFLTFKEWCNSNGWKHGLHIDRIDSNGNYEPDNCRFVTPVENSRNRSVTIMATYRGETRSLIDILERIGMANDYETIRARIKRGWADQAAIDTPIRQGNYFRGSKIF